MNAHSFVTPAALTALPYDLRALEPHLSEKTLTFHYGKHHHGYVDKLKELLRSKADWQGLSLEELMIRANGDPAQAAIFNNAAQIWNHSFYWQSMRPSGGGRPSERLLHEMERQWGSFEAFRKAFSEAAATQFGSGWTWLVLEARTLKVIKTANADNPLLHGQRPLLTLDVWEHAYYLDYQNRRTDYITVFLDHLVNWDFAAQNLGAGE